MSDWTLSLTPVLADQLERPDAKQRCLAFLREIRPESHRLDIAELRRRGATVRRRLSSSARRSNMRRPPSVWPEVDPLGGAGSAHELDVGGENARGVLPLVATDGGVDLQVQTGIASRIAGASAPGTVAWLPECAHAPWLDPVFDRVGVRSTCVELTGQVRWATPGTWGRCAPREFVLWPIDRVDDRPGVGGGRISVASPVSRLPPPHDPIAIAPGGSTARSVLIRGGARAKAQPTPRISWPGARLGWPAAG